MYDRSVVCDTKSHFNQFYFLAKAIVARKDEFLSKILSASDIPVSNFEKQKLVVLGSGWGSYTFTSKICYNWAYDTTIISFRNHFVFTPLLPQSATGILESRALVEPIRKINAKFYQATADSVEFDKKVVKCHVWNDPSSKFEVPYDKLVIGVGAEVNTFQTPGVNSENVFFLKEINDAHLLRHRLLENLQTAALPCISAERRKKLLSFVVIGGGPTGVEYAGELADFFEKDLPNLFPSLNRNDVSIHLIEVTSTILAAFDQTLVQGVIKKLEKMGVNLHFQVGVKEVKKECVFLTDGSSIESCLILWSTGVRPISLIKNLNLEKINGRILVDHQLRVKGHNDVYAIGDCAEIDGYRLPPTAQVANRQACFLAQHLSVPRIHADKFEQVILEKKESFKHSTLGIMTYVGSAYALFDTPWFKSAGYLEFIAWHFGYMKSFLSWRALFQVLYYWIRSALWGRDSSQYR